MASSPEMVELGRFDALIADSDWRRGWADAHHGTQIGVIFTLRDGVDECSVAEWPAYQGYGGSGTLIPKAAMDDMLALIKAPPAPRLRTTEEIKRVIELNESLPEQFRGTGPDSTEHLQWLLLEREGKA